MPEGDSLVRLAHRLRPVMEGRTLRHTDFRVPRLAALNLQDWIVNDVTTTGKYLSMSVQAPDHAPVDRPELIVLSHLGMDGSWQIDAQPSHQTRCIFTLDDHQVLGFSLATPEVIPSDIAHDKLAYLGPDILDRGWNDPNTADALRSQVIRNFRQAADQPIATALLDQRLVAGIGNIYRCEVLLLARISPYRTISELTDEQLAGLIALCHDLMTLNIPPVAEEQSRRSTVDVRPDPSAPFGVRIADATERARAHADRRRRRGNPPVYWVYGRQRAGCLRCGHRIRTDALGTGPTTERNVAWCPNCQRG
ncbi:MAG: formamidopyrimidine-DNA glycosylase [Yaniella sp.]|nr:formamidopyrimidine-DNA glycosylase [Yaniella sp.]